MKTKILGITVFIHVIEKEEGIYINENNIQH